MPDNIPVVECVFLSETALYQAYMPFLTGGGVFVRMNPVLALQSEVKLSIMLLSEPERYQIDARVVWITPKGAQGNKPAGIGFQFIGDNNRQFCNKIETCLAGMLKSTQPNDTM